MAGKVSRVKKVELKIFESTSTERESKRCIDGIVSKICGILKIKFNLEKMLSENVKSRKHDLHYNILAYILHVLQF